MKRVLMTLIAALVLAAASPAAPAAAADVRQPGLACADINGDSGASSYTTDFAVREAVLSLRITTVKPLCRGANLTIYFTSDTTATAIVESASYPGDSRFSACTPPVPGEGCLTFTGSYGSTNTSGSASTAPAKLYIYLETTFGRKVIDRAPNMNAGEFDLCDFDTLTPDYDSNGQLIPECNFPGGNYYE